VRLTTKGRYAVTAMLDLALHSQKNPVTLTDIATRQTISLSYLEQLFSRLRQAGMVKGVRGPGGGYTLSRQAKEINVADIIMAVDEKIDATGCEGRGDCQNGQPCLTHVLWLDLSNQIRDYLTGISLADVMQRDPVQKVADRQVIDAQYIAEIQAKEKQDAA
jgi:Rrf2 family transcriptional regulator, iron-sulfur cluster assembly transcription factor